MADVLSGVQKLKAANAKAAAAPTKPKPAYDFKAGKSPGNLFKGPRGNGPAVIVSPQGSASECVSVCKTTAFLGGMIPREQIGGVIDLSDRLKATYSPYYNFKGGHNSILVPASAAYLPTVFENGYEIPGSIAIKAECKQLLADSVKGYDPEEVRFAITKAHEADGREVTKTLNSLVDTAGGYVVAPPELGDLIDLQRNMEVFSNAGARSVGLPPNGRISFPKLTGGSTFYWVGETNAATASQEQFGTLNLEAKTGIVRVPLTNQLMRFASPAVEAIVRVDMAKQGALGIDLASLSGTGGTQIKGLITYPTATAWTQNVDKLLTYNPSGPGSTFAPEDVANMDALLPDGVTASAWVMRPELWARVWNRRGDAVAPGDGKGQFMFDRMRSLGDGAPAQWYDRKLVKSRQVSATRGTGAQTYVLTGDFSEWLIGRLGVFEFMVDPFTSMANLITNIQCVQFVDAGPRHAASFVICDSITIA